MSTRSDIFIAIKSELHEKVKHLRIFVAADEHLEHAQDHAYIFEQVCWDRVSDDVIGALYEALNEHDNAMGDGHIILEACHDYPESTDGDSGTWFDNPWGARRQVSVSIEYTAPRRITDRASAATQSADLTPNVRPDRVQAIPPTTEKETH